MLQNPKMLKQQKELKKITVLYGSVWMTQDIQDYKTNFIF